MSDEGTEAEAQLAADNFVFVGKGVDCAARHFDELTERVKDGTCRRESLKTHLQIMENLQRRHGAFRSALDRCIKAVRGDDDPANAVSSRPRR